MILDSNSAIDAAADALRDLILDGRIAPGAPLRQDALSETLAVSRTPLRQAFLLLSADGLVRMDGRKGARVGTLNRGDVDDLFDMRLALEPMALRAAAPWLNKLDFAKAEMAIDAAEGETGPARLSALNWDFHAALYAPSGRCALLETIAKLNRASAFAAVIARSITGRAAASQTEHRALLDALRAGDAGGAAEGLARHLRAAHHEARAAFAD